MMTKNLQQATQSELKFTEALEDTAATSLDSYSLLAEKQDYLDYIDADMGAFYEVKAEALGLT